MDARLLLLPHNAFVDYRHERMIRTGDGLQGNLEKGDLLFRYDCGTEGIWREQKGRFAAVPSGCQSVLPTRAGWASQGRFF